MSDIDSGEEEVRDQKSEVTGSCGRDKNCAYL